MLTVPGMRVAALLLLVGCVEAREPYVAAPRVDIASLGCQLAGAQIVIDGTWNVRLQAGQEFRVEHAAGLAAGTKTNTYLFFGCNAWQSMQDGCARMDAQPETQPVSLHMTDNITTGQLPDRVTVEVTAVVDDEADGPIEATRTLTCVR